MEQKQLKLLLLMVRPPHIQEKRINIMRNVIPKLKEKCQLKVFWLVYGHNRKDLKKMESDDLQILDLYNYNDAFEILEKIKPDIILGFSYFEFVHLSFLKAAKTKNIPTIMCFFESPVTFGKHDVKRAITSQLKLAVSQKNTAYSINSEKKRFVGIKYIFSKYRFLLKTLKKIHYTFFMLIKFSIFLFRIRISSYLALHPIMSGDLNLCSIDEWAMKLKNAGFSESSILVTGDPTTDEIFYQLKTKSKESQKKSTKRILFCTSTQHEHGVWTMDEEFELITETVKRIVEHNNDLEIDVKIHPASASIIDYQKLLKKYIPPVKIFQQENIVKLLKEYDMMITYGETSVITYGVLSKKPVIFLNIYDEAPSAIKNKNVIIECKTFDDLISKLNNAKNFKISQSDWQKFIENEFYKFDGKCSERTAEAILNLAK